MKIIISTLFLVQVLLAEVVSLIPYFGVLSDNIEKSSAEQTKGTLAGIYASVGNLSYLVEVGFSNLMKRSSGEDGIDLTQNDIALAYSHYDAKYMYKVGVHHVSTTDTSLGDGDVFMLSLGTYKYTWYDKYSYGIDGYYSNYANGLDENNISQSFSLVQVSPYFSYLNSISINSTNIFVLRGHYIMTHDYAVQDYISFEVSDSFYYKSYFATLYGYFGEMKTGVKDGGMSVYNSKDLMKSGYSAKVGYYIRKDIIMSAMVGFNTLLIDGDEQDSTNRIALATLSYSF